MSGNSSLLVPPPSINTLEDPSEKTCLSEYLRVSQNFEYSLHRMGKMNIGNRSIDCIVSIRTKLVRHSSHGSLETRTVGESRTGSILKLKVGNCEDEESTLRLFNDISGESKYPCFIISITDGSLGYYQIVVNYEDHLRKKREFEKFKDLRTWRKYLNFWMDVFRTEKLEIRSGDDEEIDDYVTISAEVTNLENFSLENGIADAINNNNSRTLRWSYNLSKVEGSREIRKCMGDLMFDQALKSEKDDRQKCQLFEEIRKLRNSNKVVEKVSDRSKIKLTSKKKNDGNITGNKRKRSKSKMNKYNQRERKRTKRKPLLIKK